jgi:hypothetical protein
MPMAKTHAKVPGMNWSGYGTPGYKSKGFNTTADQNCRADGLKLGGSWFHGYRKGQGPRNHGSNSTGRKRASAMIAKIPFPISSHIARVFKPVRAAA